MANGCVGNVKRNEWPTPAGADQRGDRTGWDRSSGRRYRAKVAAWQFAAGVRSRGFQEFCGDFVHRIIVSACEVYSDGAIKWIAAYAYSKRLGGTFCVLNHLPPANPECNTTVNPQRECCMPKTYRHLGDAGIIVIILTRCPPKIRHRSTNGVSRWIVAVF